MNSDKGRPTGEPPPYVKELNRREGGIPPEYADTAETLAGDLERYNVHHDTWPPENLPTGVLNGAEINADAALRLAYVLGRCGPLLADVLVEALCNRRPMKQLAGIDPENDAAAKVGRARLTDALHLARLAYAEFRGRKKWPRSIASAAANDNFRSSINAQFRETAGRLTAS